MRDRSCRLILVCRLGRSVVLCRCCIRLRWNSRGAIDGLVSVERRTPNNGWRKARAPRAFEHVLRQLAVFLVRPARNGVVCGKIIAARTGKAIPLGQGERTAQGV